MGEIYLVRHAQASFNSDDYDALSPTGHHQARHTAVRLANTLKVDHIISGSMKRHLETAGAYRDALSSPPSLQIEDGFNEFNHKEIIARFNPMWQDATQLKNFLNSDEMPRKKFIEIFLQALRRWMSGHHDAEYSESWPMFSERVNRSLSSIRDAAGSSKSTVVFTSGGPISTICQRLLRLDNDVMLDVNRNLVNASVTRVLYTNNKLSISYLNNYSHLESDGGELVTFI